MEVFFSVLELEAIRRSAPTASLYRSEICDEVVRKEGWDENEDLVGGFEERMSVAVLMSDESGRRGSNWRRVVRIKTGLKDAGHCPDLS